MLYFLDTEFYEDGTTIDLISIGIVAGDGREFYACSLDARLDRCHAENSWMRENVLAQLPRYADKGWMRRGAIKQAVLDFVLAPKGPDRNTRDWGNPEFWCYYGASDWVAFYQLFGPLIRLPVQFPRWFRELKQLAADVGAPKLPAKPEGAHNALVDARWNRDVYEFLTARRATVKPADGDSRQ